MVPTIRPQKDFPFIEEYRKRFGITKYTIFAGGDSIYTDFPLTKDLMIHEMVHLKQQAEVGLTNWVYDFLENPEMRLKYELEAYRIQLQSIKDRNYRNKVRLESAKNLSSSLYGNIISYEEAFKQLKV
jgi:hypothetical protein